MSVSSYKFTLRLFIALLGAFTIAQPYAAAQCSLDLKSQNTLREIKQKNSHLVSVEAMLRDFAVLDFNKTSPIELINKHGTFISRPYAFTSVTGKDGRQERDLSWERNSWPLGQDVCDTEKTCRTADIREWYFIPDSTNFSSGVFDRDNLKISANYVGLGAMVIDIQLAISDKMNYSEANLKMADIKQWFGDSFLPSCLMYGGLSSNKYTFQTWLSTGYKFKDLEGQPFRFYFTTVRLSKEPDKGEAANVSRISALYLFQR
jgi:hypothetical protein